MMHLRSRFANLPHPGLFSSLTNMGVPGQWPARANLDTLTPIDAGTIMGEIADYIKDRVDIGLDVLPLNVRALGACCLVWDLDFKDTLTGEQQDERDENVTELAELFRRTARQHFVSFDGPVYVAKSNRGNYHIHLPGFVYTELSVALLLLKMVRAKAKSGIRELCDAIDTAPLGQMHMRMHGTDNKALQGKGVYKVIYPSEPPTGWQTLTVR